ncbi:hypothetical protein [Halomonas sp. BC1]|uniref:hypothetical protein n=1 Tax=Halomonas sp. BC1 TaxID=1670448 RepID=UPI0009BE2DB1|nr:hypothetical protein [Halomonas sp. BC1]
MNTLIFNLAALILLLAGFCLGWYFGENVSFSDQWPLFEALRNTAAIIFAVVGAWFAIIYPERMKGILNRKSPSPLAVSAGEGIGKLFSPIVHSTIILCIILLIGILAPLAKQIDYLVANSEYLRRFSFGMLYVLTFWQIWTVLVALIPALLLKEASDQQKLDEDNLKAYSSNKTIEPPVEEGSNIP